MTERVRFMRLFVFFDLPVVTAAQRRAHARFRKFLVKEGYIMMQESVYTKLAINDRVVASYIDKLKANRPPEGLVQALRVTEQQYAEMKYIVGKRPDGEVLEDTETLVVL